MVSQQRLLHSLWSRTSNNIVSFMQQLLSASRIEARLACLGCCMTDHPVAMSHFNFYQQILPKRVIL